MANQHHARHHQQHTSHMVVDPPNVDHHSMTTPQCGVPAPITSSRYHSMPTYNQHVEEGSEGLQPMEYVDFASMAPVSMGASYTVNLTPPTLSHHRQPGPESLAKVIDREYQGGAPSVVGQEGMPEPAAPPKGPKIKFTAEDDQLLIELKEEKNLTWKQIADFFPGRSSGTLQVRYCTKLKGKTGQWSEEWDKKLGTALNNYENEKWHFVSSKLGANFSPAACRDRAGQLWGDARADFNATSLHCVESFIPEASSSQYSQPLG